MRRRRTTREGQEQRKREKRQPILKKLCAALLRSFRGQHSEKMKGITRGNWDPREGQLPFRPNPNGVRDRTTTLRWLFIDAVLLSIFSRIHFFLYPAGNVLSQLNFLTNRFPRYLLKNCAPSSILLSPLLSSLQQTQPTIKLLSLESAESRILHAQPEYTRHWTLVILFFTVQLRCLCAACFFTTLCLYDLRFKPWGVARLLGLHGVLPWSDTSEGVG